MLIAYNWKMKNGLKWSKLYTNKSDVPDDMELDDGDDEECMQEVLEY